MKKEELDKLWELYRKFCNATNQANVAMYVPEFLVYLEKFELAPQPSPLPEKES